ncbi:GNAT family N-acetyltransferase [Granulicella cerasi]|uniref:GNAT family N-acetyltransferase n=1 Tax=Granulicella cerasi TaxID=741063 RepID=A0ABW1Z5L5_9BACT|nr:GNAT family N-acetyltransferase [Granulicella cerasi]
MAILIEEATFNDLAAMARLRGDQWGSPNEWEPRLTAYMIRQQTPPYGLEPRAFFVAVDDTENEVVGLIAGHLTTRFGCKGEIQWLDVDSRLRGQRIADKLLDAMFAWFRSQGAAKICVNVTPTNDSARTVFLRRDAEAMGTHWMVFNDISAT